jgi:hypothetical protein
MAEVIKEEVATAVAVREIMEKAAPGVTMVVIMVARAEAIQVAPDHPGVGLQQWILKKEEKLPEWADVLPMVEMVEEVTVAHEAVIPDALVETVQIVPADVAVPGVLLPAVIVEGVHRIVRVVLVRPVEDLPQCPKRN